MEGGGALWYSRQQAGVDFIDFALSQVQQTFGSVFLQVWVYNRVNPFFFVWYSPILARSKGASFLCIGLQSGTLSTFHTLDSSCLGEKGCGGCVCVCTCQGRTSQRRGRVKEGNSSTDIAENTTIKQTHLF